MTPFESFLTRQSADFVALSAEAVDDALADALQRVVEHFDFDRSSLAQFEPPTSDELWVTHSWARDGLATVEPQPLEGIDSRLAQRLRQGEMIRVRGAGDLPAAIGSRRPAYVPT